MSHVRFAARDTGGAQVVAAFLERWPARGAHTFDVWAMGLATRVFARAGFFVRSFLWPSEVIVAWARRPPDLLVTGTSHRDPPQFERLLWSLARECRIPSLALLDSYMNLAQRFGGVT